MKLHGSFEGMSEVRPRDVKNILLDDGWRTCRPDAVARQVESFRFPGLFVSVVAVEDDHFFMVDHSGEPSLPGGIQHGVHVTRVRTFRPDRAVDDVRTGIADRCGEALAS